MAARLRPTAPRLASFSPELFLRRTGRTVVTGPIKGTSTDRAALVASEKDRAENVMIVDLMRNDLGKSCAYGSVSVAQLAYPTLGPGVWHLVSEVTGALAPGVRDSDLVRGCFPPGSVTGAPKIKSMEVISQLESTGRETYTGAIGYASPVAGLELRNPVLAGSGEATATREQIRACLDAGAAAVVAKSTNESGRTGPCVSW